MKLGLMLITQDPPRAEGIARRWQELLQIADVAEESGFSGVFVPEHHMAEDGCLPSPLVGLAVIAARTTRIELGTAALLLPFHHPIRVAEDAAVVDVISNGRLRLGCGLGNLDVGAALFDVDRASQVGRLEESLDLVRRAWAGEEFDHRGEGLRTAGRISPLPIGAELWLAGMSAAGAGRAARLGLPWLSDPLHNNAVVAHWADLYRRGGREHGTSGDLHVVMIRDGWVADSLEEAKRAWWPHAHADLSGRIEYFRSAPRAVAERDPVLAGIAAGDDLDFERHRTDRLIVGSPEDCVDQIRALDRAVGMDFLIMRLRMPSGPGFRDELACIRRFGAEVIPALARRVAPPGFTAAAVRDRADVGDGAKCRR
jgi:alkanesulfonate monooxygenase SsuD/methylene tetrahydromethanopterin reductase-like flavin-dependent oxidoreductase (luciferase family)